MNLLLVILNVREDVGQSRSVPFTACAEGEGDVNNGLRPISKPPREARVGLDSGGQLFNEFDVADDGGGRGECFAELFAPTGGGYCKAEHAIPQHGDGVRCSRRTGSGALLISANRNEDTEFMLRWRSEIEVVEMLAGGRVRARGAG